MTDTDIRTAVDDAARGNIEHFGGYDGYGAETYLNVEAFIERLDEAGYIIVPKEAP